MLRRQSVAQLYLQGYTQGEIAAKEGVTQATICNDLKHIRKEWLASSLRAFDELKGEELARIDELERVAWDAWRRSQEAEKSQSTKTEVNKGAKGESGVSKAVKQEMATTRVGSPKFLDIVFRCIEARVKILGLIKDVTVNNVAIIGLNNLLDQISQEPPPLQIDVGLPPLEANGQIENLNGEQGNGEAE